MRRTNSQRFRFAYALSILILLLSSVFMLALVNAQEEKPLYIALFDCEQQKYLDIEQGVVFLEGNQYDIEVFYEDDTEPTRAYNVTIDLPWNSFFIASGDVNSWITIEAPSFEEYSEFVITASKEGYTPAEQYVIVSKGNLFVLTDRDTVEEEGSFSVTIKDRYDNLVPGATVYVEGHENVFDKTNEDGKAFINAPEVDVGTEINVTVVKSGYYPSSSTIHVENVKATDIGDFLSKIFEVSPIVFALFIVLFAMLFVKLRKKTPMSLSVSKTDTSQINSKLSETKKEPWPAKLPLSKQKKYINKKIEEKIPSSTKGPHVEIIRIHAKEEKKETKHISDKKEPSNILLINKNNDYEWFNGTDYMKYKINKLTGDVNEKPTDKWFVGEDVSRFKVDKKLADKKLKKNTKKNTS